MSTRSIFLFCSEKGSWLSFSLKSWNSDPWIVIDHPHLLVGPRTARRHPAPTLGEELSQDVRLRRDARRVIRASDIGEVLSGVVVLGHLRLDDAAHVVLGQLAARGVGRPGPDPGLLDGPGARYGVDVDRLGVADPGQRRAQSGNRLPVARLHRGGERRAHPVAQAGRRIMAHAQAAASRNTGRVAASAAYV